MTIAELRMHCPNCQFPAKAKWLDPEMEEIILPGRISAESIACSNPAVRPIQSGGVSFALGRPLRRARHQGQLPVDPSGISSSRCPVHPEPSQ